MWNIFKSKPKVSKTAQAMTATGAAAAIALTIVAPWEGLRLNAYPDIVGVWTVCYGETQGVKKGDQYTVAQCEGMLAKRIGEFERELDKCMKPARPLSPKTKAAFISWTYNVGWGAACKSTLVRLVNAGQVARACDELLKWNRAGGRVVKGLTNRREAERRICLEGLA